MQVLKKLTIIILDIQFENCSKIHDVTKDNAMSVWLHLYGGKRNRKPLSADIKIGDRVRISKVKSTFEKGYLPNWTEEEFFVHDINKLEIFKW